MTVGSFPKREILRVGLSEIPPVTGWLREVTVSRPWIRNSSPRIFWIWPKVEYKGRHRPSSDRSICLFEWASNRFPRDRTPEGDATRSDEEGRVGMRGLILRRLGLLSRSAGSSHGRRRRKRRGLPLGRLSFFQILVALNHEFSPSVCWLCAKRNRDSRGRFVL
jgi:hypothetical protein